MVRKSEEVRRKHGAGCILLATIAATTTFPSSKRSLSTIDDPSSREALERIDISVIYGQLQREITPLATTWHQGEGDASVNPYTAFTNMICGDYHAGYYGYPLSEMYAIDIWENGFEGDGGNKEAGTAERGSSAQCLLCGMTIVGWKEEVRNTDYRLGDLIPM